MIWIDEAQFARSAHSEHIGRFFHKKTFCLGRGDVIAQGKVLCQEQGSITKSPGQRPGFPLVGNKS